MDKSSARQEVQLSLREDGVCKVTIDHEKVAEISPDGSIVTFKDTQRANEAVATPELFISKDFKTVAMYGTSITVVADGKLLVSPKGTLKVKLSSSFAIGGKTKEGIYIGYFAGKSGDARHWFADLTDAGDSKGKRLSLDFNEAAAHVKNVKSFGHDDWILPPGDDDRNGRPDILKAIFNCKDTGAFENTFDETSLRDDIGAHLTGYWSSSHTGGADSDRAMMQELGNGRGSSANKSKKFFVRAVRSVKI